jgi:type II secretory pathway pseudopilin PulG
LEIIVALGLVSVVALAVIGVFSKLMTSSSKTADQAAAELLAQSTLDKSIRVGPPNWGVPDGEVTLKTADASSRTEFLYRVQGEELPDSDHHLGSLYRVTVLVSWGGSLAKTERLDQGKLWVERSRMTYVEATDP